MERTDGTRGKVVLAALFPSVALGLLNGLYNPTLAHAHSGWYWVADAVQFVLVPAGALWILVRYGRFRLRDFGFGRLSSEGHSWEFVGLAGLVTFLYWLSYEPISALANQFFWESAASAPFVDALPHTQPLRILAVFYVTLTAALVEEPVFRSLPWLYFSSVSESPVLPYVLTTSFLFAAIHWEQGLPSTIAAGSLGLVAAILYTKILNVWPFVAAHFATGAWSYQWL